MAGLLAAATVAKNPGGPMKCKSKLRAGDNYIYDGHHRWSAE
jgi:hypothetical protein